MEMEIITWYPDNTLTLPNVPRRIPKSGMTTFAINRISDIPSCFGLFVTEEILQLVLESTNLEGRRKPGCRGWVPGRNFTVDEQLVPFKGRCSFQVYMPQKPGRRQRLPRDPGLAEVVVALRRAGQSNSQPAASGRGRQRTRQVLALYRSTSSASSNQLAASNTASQRNGSNLPPAR
ncbi:hypothetical protein ABVT39_000988 [Epinephelus coioides]